jgi:outer membrane immunogenic protein
MSLTWGLIMRRLQSVLLATVAAIGFASIASAADMPVKAPVYKAAPVAMYNWSGFYIGANGGWGSSSKCWDYAGTAAVPLATYLSEGCHNATGGMIGGQIGYNWQVASWVFGLEAQFDWANLKGSNVSAAFPTFTNQSKIDGLGLFTGRIGYAWNNAMLYAKGGAAVANDKYNYYPTATGIDTGTASETRWGGVVGVGLEYGFTPNWSVAIEYDHLFLGSRTITFASPTTTVDSISQKVDMVTARINYRFGGL